MGCGDISVLSGYVLSDLAAAQALRRSTSNAYILDATINSATATRFECACQCALNKPTGHGHRARTLRAQSLFLLSVFYVHTEKTMSKVKWPLLASGSRRSLHCVDTHTSCAARWESVFLSAPCLGVAYADPPLCGRVSLGGNIFCLSARGFPPGKIK
jgi:hypothetical protein